MESISSSGMRFQLGQPTQLYPQVEHINQFQSLLQSVNTAMASGKPALEVKPANVKMTGASPNIENITPDPVQEAALRVHAAEVQLQSLKSEINRFSENIQEHAIGQDELVSSVVHQQLSSASYFIYLNHMESGVSNFSEELDTVVKRR